MANTTRRKHPDSRSHQPTKRPARASTARKAAAKRKAKRTYQRILVPLDGSRTSFAALRAALVLARDLEATVVGYHSLPTVPVPQFDAPPAGLPSPSEHRAMMRQLAQRYFEKSARLAALVGVPFETVSDAKAEVADAIAAAARRKRCDLILLGSHGRGAFRRLLMGSVATRLLSIAPVPVMVLPKQAIARPT